MDLAGAGMLVKGRTSAARLTAAKPVLTRCIGLRLCCSIAWAIVVSLTVPGPASPQGLVDAVASNYRAYLPDGVGPFPTLVAIPGCSGVSLDGPSTDSGRPGDEGDRLFRRHYPRMAERLRGRGYAVILVDYLTPEGVANTCAREISHERVGEYIEASLEFARQQTYTDRDHLYVIGWSHGGAGVIAWLQAQEVTRPSVAGAVGIYPECDTRGPWKTSLPVLLLLGTADDIALPERCDRIAPALPGQANLRLRRFEGARHGFDLTEGPEVLDVGGGYTVGRNDEAGQAAWVEVFRFLGDVAP